MPPRAATSAARWPKSISRQRLADALAWLKKHGRVAPEITLMQAAQEHTLMSLLCSTARQHAAQAKAERLRRYRAWATDFKALAAKNDD